MAALLVVSLMVAQTWAKGIEVEKVSTRLRDDVYWINAQLLYHPSKAVLDALEHGVPLTFEVRIKVRRKEAWLWDRTVAKQLLRYQVRYQALVSMYEVFLPDQRTLRFSTLDGALRALGELADVPLVRASELDQGEEYQLRLSVELDIESLPVPLRPRAYLSSDWSLSHESRAWPLTP